MSEVLNAKITNGEATASFSRRRVVKGVAWSVPVIVTAIAAPAAATSGLHATAGFAGAGSTVTLVGSAGTGSGTNRGGTGPTAFQIQNAGGAINSPISGTITITPVGVVEAGLGVQSILPAALAAPSYSAAHAYSASFTYAAGVASGHTANLPIHFQYESVNPLPKKGVAYSYDMTVTVTLPDATTQVLAAQLTITF